MNRTDSERRNAERFIVGVDRQFVPDDERIRLTEIFREHGLEGEVVPYARRSWTDQAPILVLSGVAAIGLKKWVEMLFEQAYDAWFKDLVASILFQRESAQLPVVRLQAGRTSVIITARDQIDLDEAIARLPAIAEILEQQEWLMYGSDQVRTLNYSYGSWRMLAKAFYEYDSLSRKFTPLKSQEDADIQRESSSE